MFNCSVFCWQTERVPSHWIYHLPAERKNTVSHHLRERQQHRTLASKFRTNRIVPPHNAQTVLCVSPSALSEPEPSDTPATARSAWELNGPAIYSSMSEGASSVTQRILRTMSMPGYPRQNPTLCKSNLAADAPVEPNQTFPPKEGKMPAKLTERSLTLYPVGCLLCFLFVQGKRKEKYLMITLNPTDKKKRMGKTVLVTFY